MDLLEELSAKPQEIMLECGLQPVGDPLIDNATVRNLADELKRSCASFQRASSIADQQSAIADSLLSITKALRTSVMFASNTVIITELIAAIGKVVGGAQHPLLMPDPKSAVDRRDPVRDVQIIAAIVCSHLFSRGGRNWKEADSGAASVMSELGVNGVQSIGLSRKTVEGWRLSTRRFGKRQDLAILISRYLKDFPDVLPREKLRAAAKASAQQLLALPGMKTSIPPL